MKMSPKNGVGKGDDLELGKKLYADNCVRCHGENGAGDAAKYYPRIQGQHYEYLIRQYQLDQGRQAPQLQPRDGRADQELHRQGHVAVLDYVSRLKPSADILAPEGYKNQDFK
jgi:cytochrome c553